MDNHDTLTLSELREAMLFDTTETWITHRSADNSFSVHSLFHGSDALDPTLLLLGELLVVKKQGFIEIHETRPSHDISIQLSAFSKEYLPYVRTRIYEVSSSEGQQLFIQTTVLFEVTQALQGRLKKLLKIKPSASHAKHAFLSLTIASLIGGYARAFALMMEDLKLAIRSGDEIKITMAYQTLEKAQADFKRLTFKEEQRIWRNSLKTLESQTGPLHRRAEDYFYSLLQHHHTLTGMRIQLGQALNPELQKTHESQESHTSNDELTLIHGQESLLHPDSDSLCALIHARQQLFYLLRRAKVFSDSKRLVGYVWSWRFNTAVGYYLDLWLLFSGTFPHTNTQHQAIRRLWETQVQLKSASTSDKVADTRPLTDVTDQLDRLRPQAQTDSPDACRYSKSIQRSQQLGNRFFTCDSHQDLQAGLSVIQLFYQGKLFQWPTPLHEGKSLPGVGKGQLPKGVKPMRLKETLRVSQPLHRLLPQLPTRLNFRKAR